MTSLKYIVVRVDQENHPIIFPKSLPPMEVFNQLRPLFHNKLFNKNISKHEAFIKSAGTILLESISCTHGSLSLNIFSDIDQAKKDEDFIESYSKL